MVTPLDVLDTAVKIGLGALIGAASSFLTLRAQHTQKRQMEEIGARRALLETIAMAMPIYTSAVRGCIHAIRLGSRGHGNDEIQSATANLLRAYDDFGAAITKAALISDDLLLRSLQEYWTVATSFYYRFTERSDDIELGELVPLVKEIQSRSDEVKRALGVAYSRLWQP